MYLQEGRPTFAFREFDIPNMEKCMRGQLRHNQFRSEGSRPGVVCKVMMMLFGASPQVFRPKFEDVLPQ